MNRKHLNAALRATRIVLPALLLLPSACSGGINAGEEGGQAFIAMAIMLVAVLAILWLILGREK